MNILARAAGFFGRTDPLALWLMAFLLCGFLTGVFTGYFRARKIQLTNFRWRIFRHELIYATLSLLVSGVLLGGLSKFLQLHGFVAFNHEPGRPWVIVTEFVLYCVGFDTYFYWLHRLMHVDPVYTWVHKIHHRSISPNLLTTLSVNPLEALINGGFVPLFTALLTVHTSTMAIIGPTNIIMGLYVHSGYELLPRWWNRSWLTKWFITATFHDQHHRFFKGNYGGYTTVWDRICGTVRPTFSTDFEKITTRRLSAARSIDASE